MGRGAPVNVVTAPAGHHHPTGGGGQARLLCSWSTAHAMCADTRCVCVFRMCRTAFNLGAIPGGTSPPCADRLPLRPCLAALCRVVPPCPCTLPWPHRLSVPAISHTRFPEPEWAVRHRHDSPGGLPLWCFHSPGPSSGHTVPVIPPSPRRDRAREGGDRRMVQREVLRPISPSILSGNGRRLKPHKTISAHPPAKYDPAPDSNLRHTPYGRVTKAPPCPIDTPGGTPRIAAKRPRLKQPPPTHSLPTGSPA